jgi:hypothetical protein
MDTSKTLGVDLLLRSQKSEPLDSFIENMTVFVLNLSGHGYNLSKMGSESEMQTRNMITDVEILESRLDSSSSEHFYVLKYNGRQGKFLLTTEQRFYLKNDVGFAITFTSERANEKSYQQVYSFIFNSVKLL